MPADTPCVLRGKNTVTEVATSGTVKVLTRKQRFTADGVGAARDGGQTFSFSPCFLNFFLGGGDFLFLFSM